MTTARRAAFVPLLCFAGSLGGLGAVPDSAVAQARSATAHVTFEVREINELSLSGDPEPLILTRSGTDSDPAVVDTRTTWEITTNQPGRKVTGLLNDELPSGLTLSVSLDPPAGATSQGLVPLTTTARDLIVDFGSVHASRLGVTYSLAATPEAGVLARASRLVTFTILAGV